MERREVDAKATGEFLAALRKSRGYTQQEVADLLGVTNKTVSKWERGEGLPEISMLPVLAEVYEVTADEILAGRRLEKEDKEPRQKKAVAGQWKYCFDRAYQRLANFCILAAVISLTGFLMMETAKIFLMKIMNGKIVVLVSAVGMLWFLLIALVLLIIGFRMFLQKLGDYPEEEEPKLLYSKYLKKAIKRVALTAGIFVLFGIWNLGWKLMEAYPINLDRLSLVSMGFNSQFEIGEYLASVLLGANLSLVPEEYFKILIKGLPLSIVIGSFAGVLVLLWLRKHYQSQLAEALEVRKQFRKQILACLLVLCVGMIASGGFKVYMNNVIDTGIADKMSESEFPHFVNQYFYTYEAFRNVNANKDKWPEYKEGDTEINAEDFDYTIFMNGRLSLRKYVGVIRFDYENNTVYRRYIGEELVKKQRETRNGSALILGVTCILAGAAWFVCRPKESDPE